MKLKQGIQSAKKRYTNYLKRKNIEMGLLCIKKSYLIISDRFTRGFKAFQRGTGRSPYGLRGCKVIGDQTLRTIASAENRPGQPNTGLDGKFFGPSTLAIQNFSDLELLLTGKFYTPV